MRNCISMAGFTPEEPYISGEEQELREGKEQRVQSRDREDSKSSVLQKAARGWSKDRVGKQKRCLLWEECAGARSGEPILPAS